MDTVSPDPDIITSLSYNICLQPSFFCFSLTKCKMQDAKKSCRDIQNHAHLDLDSKKLPEPKSRTTWGEDRISGNHLPLELRRRPQGRVGAGTEHQHHPRLRESCRLRRVHAHTAACALSACCNPRGSMTPSIEVHYFHPRPKALPEIKK